MARSRSRSRDRSRRKYSSSDDSEYDRRKRSGKKKKRSSRSRSRSTESNRRRYKSKDGSRYDDDSRSYSRSEKRDSKHRKSRRDRSRDRSPSNKSRREREVGRTERSSTREHSHGSSTDRAKIVAENTATLGSTGLSLKERVATLAKSSNEKVVDIAVSETERIIDHEKVAEIDSQDFHQQTFVSNAFERDVSKGFNGKSAFDGNVTKEHDNHADAIFGSSSNTVTTLSALTIANGPNQGIDDGLFGPRLLLDQKIKTEKWLTKLRLIRQSILEESV